LIVASGTLGYLLTDHSFGPVPVAEQLRLDVARTVEVVLGTQELEQRVEQRTRELRAAQSELVDSARRAGMAEIATNVLHNVGNVLTSVNVSAGLVMDKMRGSKVEGMCRVADLLSEHQADLGTFLTSDQKGKLLPGYLTKLSQTLSAEHRDVQEELALLMKNIDHIRTIVTTQQSYAGSARIVEPARISELIDDALHINMESLTRHEVSVIKEFAEIPVLLLDRPRIVLILVNLISNAKSAMDGMSRGSRILTISVSSTAEHVLRLSVKDTGEGICKENLDRIFTHGFTTRQEGHGFGLHSCALAATEMGGALAVRSDGPGRGAVFTLELPMKAP
jgi:two-component system NtrC family sensor kinase